jgi:RNA polymerase sigma-70 factor, ECF subfamily
VDNKQKEFLDAYLPVQDNLWRYCLFMTKNREYAKDLLGDTLVVAYQHFEGIREQKAFLSWLFTISSRLYFKSKKKIVKLINDITELEQLLTSDLNPEILSDISFLNENLNKLNIEQKEAIILFNIEGFSRAEVAKIQNVSEQTVKTRLARGRKKLAKLMGINYE